VDGAFVRGLRAGDEAGFGSVVGRALEAGDLEASADPRAEWTTRFAFREPDQSAVAEAGGRIVGFILPESKALVVEPAYRRRGIGVALVEAGLAIERALGHDALILGVLPGDEEGRSFLARTGFRYHSTVWDLELDPDAAMAEPVWAQGLRARCLDSTRDIGPWVALFNAAFAEHATPVQLDLERTVAEWDAWPTRDEDIALVEDGDGRLVGFCATEPLRLAGGGVETRAEIWTVGVHPDRQGQGIGRQLLRWGVAHLRGLGARTVALSVNDRNAGALRLYESEGFRRTSTRERWARLVAPAPDP
jgi:mycothiol synthase